MRKLIDNPRAVVIGYGFAGRCFHSYLVGLAPGLTLHGIASRDAATRERITQERGCRAYDSFEAVLADPDVDLVVLATPNNTHAELAIQAMQAGKHVVTDKVMCLTLADCDRMIDTAQETDRFLTVFQNRRWDGDYLTLHKLAADSSLGDLRWLEMAWQGFGPWSGWRGQAAMGGGRFYDLGAHLVDQLVMTFPQAVQSVYCRMQHDYTDSDIDSEAFLVVTFEDGRTGVCDLSGLAAKSKPRFYARGTSGTWEKYGLDPQEKAMIAENIDAAKEDPENYGRLATPQGETIIPTLPGRWRCFYENVAAVLSSGAEPAVTLPSARRAIGVLDAARRSAETNTVIEPNLPALLS